MAMSSSVLLSKKPQLVWRPSASCTFAPESSTLRKSRALLCTPDKVSAKISQSTTSSNGTGEQLPAVASGDRMGTAIAWLRNHALVLCLGFLGILLCGLVVASATGFITIGGGKAPAFAPPIVAPPPASPIRPPPASAPSAAWRGLKSLFGAPKAEVVATTTIGGPGMESTLGLLWVLTVAVSSGAVGILMGAIAMWFKK